MTTVAERKLSRVQVREYRGGELGQAERVAPVEKPAGGMIRFVWVALRLSVGWTFFWAFVDKLFGLGFATEAGKGWIDGGSPTFGFLNFATKGPFAELYSGMAASPVVEWLFMLGLLGIGLPLLLGAGVRIAGSAGVVMYLMMYTAGSILPEHNPFMDEHLIGVAIMVGLILTATGSPIGLGKIWVRTRLVERYPILR